MRTVSQNNKILKNYNHRIFVLPVNNQYIYEITRVKENASFFDKYKKDFVIESIMTTNDYLKVCNHVNEIIKAHGTGLVGAR